MGRISTILLLAGVILSSAMTACSMIDEGACRVNYINYQYRNNAGQDATDQLAKMTDFIFTKDSVLYRVDDDIMNGHRRKRPISLPDGEWIVITYGNMNGASKVDYTLGKTRLSEMTTRVAAESTYGGTYAPSADGDNKLGNSDQLYFGKVNLNVKGNTVDRKIMVEMSNVHIRLEIDVRWVDGTMNNTRANENLHARLEFVPVEHRFIDRQKLDADYNIPYRTPQLTQERVSYVSKLYPSGASGSEFRFTMRGLRWETGEAPVLKIYDGTDQIVSKDLPLNRYFEDQDIDLTNTRVQFYPLKVEINGSMITISAINIGDWDDGGSMN